MHETPRSRLVAYGGDPGMSEEEILAKLLKLILQRSEKRR
jgi:hypothetical protein